MKATSAALSLRWMELSSKAGCLRRFHGSLEASVAESGVIGVAIADHRHRLTYCFASFNSVNTFSLPAKSTNTCYTFLLRLWSLDPSPLLDVDPLLHHCLCPSPASLFWALGSLLMGRIWSYKLYRRPGNFTLMGGTSSYKLKIMDVCTTV